MRLTYILLTTGFLSLLLACSSPPPAVTEDEAFAILNEIIADDTLGIQDICATYKDAVFSAEMKKEFTAEEVVFIERQLSGARPVKIKERKIRWFHRNWKKDDFARLDNACENGSVQISYPIISPNRKKVLWKTHHPGTFLSGSGGTYLYVKQNRHWVLKKGFDQWIANNFKNKYPGNSSL